MKRRLPWLLAAVLLPVAIGMQEMVDRRPEKKEMVAANPFHKLPPSQYMAEYSASMLLGGLRAVAIDYLWLQFMKAERERRFVEVNAILEMIAYLQPTFSEVWNHLSWARAYNIAAQMESKEDRWRWVRSGLDAIDKAVERNPANERVWFYKAYMRYHRLPQEVYLMEQYRQDTGRDCWEDAATAMEQAILVAQAKGKDNTTPPGDGILQDASIRWAFEEMKRGEYVRARKTLKRGHDTYRRLMAGRPITDMNEHNNGVFVDLDPVFALEEQVAGGAAGERGRLLAAYVALELEYVHIQPIEQRIVVLTGEFFREALALAAAGKPADGSRRLGETALDLFLRFTDDPRVRGGATKFWADMAFLATDVTQALDAEARGDAAGALKKYDEIVEKYRYALPPDNPQMPAVEKRAAELRPR